MQFSEGDLRQTPARCATMASTPVTAAEACLACSSVASSSARAAFSAVRA
nr:Uncharacterised protein [Klebsiella pneumoniae]